MIRQKLGFCFLVVFAASCKHGQASEDSTSKESAIALVIPSMPAKVCETKFDHPDWVSKPLAYDAGDYSGILTKMVEIRSGYRPAMAPQTKGNILYLQGLGDSMMNHKPLFDRITAAGYGVIAFDYMGQGGSCGTMNNTRIATITGAQEKREIAVLAKAVWNLYRSELHDQEEPTAIIGWSTGGLAAYKFAAETAGKAWGKKFVLIAPGICPRTFVGKTTSLAEIQADYDAGNLKLMEILSENLTVATGLYETGKVSNPHVDAISPNSPVKVPKFAVNLLVSSYLSRHSWAPNQQIKGLVLLSDAADTYVDPECTREIFRKYPNFRIRQYDKALHEIDNEVPSTQRNVQNDIVNFLDE
jgi:alpha-beta hydrolase superfamily lysophospholipase